MVKSDPKMVFFNYFEKVLSLIFAKNLYNKIWYYSLFHYKSHI